MITVYIDMVADLFHKGHVNILKRAKEQGDILIVGIHSDKDVESYKRVPVLTMEERISVVESCKYVDKVIPNAPLQVTPQYLDSLGVDIIVHGDDITPESREKMYGLVMDRYKEFSYTEGVSTTNIIERLKYRIEHNEI